MENEQSKKYWFFGSKLNTALLLVLIILMVIALRWMYQEKERYISIVDNKIENSIFEQTIVEDKIVKDSITKEKTKVFLINKVDVNKNRIDSGISDSNRPGFSIEYNKDYNVQVNYDNNCEPSPCFSGITVLQPTGAIGGMVSVEEYLGPAGDSILGKEIINGILYEKRQSNEAPQLYIYTTMDKTEKYVITVIEVGKNHEVFNLGSLKFIYN